LKHASQGKPGSCPGGNPEAGLNVLRRAQAALTMGIGRETRGEAEAAFPWCCGVKASSSGLFKSGLGRMSLLAWAQNNAVKHAGRRRRVKPY